MIRCARFLAVTAAVLAQAAFLAACGSGGGGAEEIQMETAMEATTVTTCGPDQVRVGHTPMWTHSQCAPFESKWLTRDSLDSVSGLPLGMQDVSNGALSIRFTGLDNAKMSHRETFGIFFQAGGETKKEASWRWTSFDTRLGHIRSRLGVHRADASCPERGCSQDFDTEELQFRDPKETYQWDCTWHLVKNRVYCLVTKPADPAYKVWTWNRPDGRFAYLMFLGVGKNAYTGDYPSYDAIASDFKITIFD